MKGLNQPDSPRAPASVLQQTSEERETAIRAFVNKVKVQNLNEFPLEKLGFEVNKIDYTSFRRNFGSLMN